MIVTGKAKIPMSDDLDPSYEVHRGPSAFFNGVLVLIISTPLLVAAVAFLILGEDRATALSSRIIHARNGPVVG